MSADHLPEQPAVLRGGLRFESDTLRDDRLYEAGWYVDFRARWKADLERERLIYRARMEGI